METCQLAQAFLNGEAMPGVKFFHNDLVRVVAGSHVGKVGSLVTVLTLEPQPRFVLELESGHDVEVMQSDIEHAGA